MTAKFKIDENLPQQIAAILSDRFLDAVSVLAQGWQGISDDTLWQRIQAEGRCLITADKGFGDLRRYPPGSHCGVVLLRPAVESRRAYIELAVRAFSNIDLESLAGAVIVVTPRGIRVRR